MILDPFPLDDSHPLTALQRKPDETLLAYLIRYQWELAGRIRQLAAARDASITLLGVERLRWRRRELWLTFTGPTISALVYAALACSTMVDTVPTAIISALVACAGIAGVPLTLGAARIADRFSQWLAARRQG
jgi:hypothetical protein